MIRGPSTGVTDTDYRGKLRGALAFDAWEDDPEIGGDEVPPGWVFLPVADGIFEAALKDVNDLEVFREHMATSLTRYSRRLLFDGMTEAQIQQIEEANHVYIPDTTKPLPEQYQYSWDPLSPPWVVTCEIE